MKLKNLLRSDLCVITLLTLLAFVASEVVPYEIGNVECAWLAAAIAAVAAIGSSIIGNASNNSTNNANEDINERNIQLAKETNELNAQLTRDTNAQNYRIFQEQNAFNLDMWNKQNEYNSPAKEVQRLLAAGINPASKFGSSTPASSITSANAAPQVAPKMESPVASLSMRPYDFAGLREAGFNAVNAFNASQLANAETKNKNALTSGITLDNTLKSQGMADSLKMLKNMAKEKGIVGDIAKRNLDFLNATFDLDMQMKYGDFRQQQLSLDMLDKQITWQQIQNDTANIVLSYQSELSKAQIAQIWQTVHKANAEIGLIMENTAMTREMKKTEIEKRVGVVIDNGLKGVNFNVQNRLKDYVVQTGVEEASQSVLNTNRMASENHRGSFMTKIFGSEDFPTWWNAQGRGRNNLRVYP